MSNRGANSRPTRERIIREAIRLIGERGYSETTIGEIEKAAGLSPRAGGFYRHFESKEDMLVKALDHPVAEMIWELRLEEIVSLGSIRAELLVIARALIRHAEAHRPLRLLFQREGHKLPALRRAAKRANARFAALDVVPWVKTALARSRRAGPEPGKLALLIFGPVIVYFVGQDRGDPPFGVDDAEGFLPLWADHWSEWFGRDGQKASAPASLGAPRIK